MEITMDYFEWQVKAATDAEFRQRLIDDPKSVLAECGVEIPAGTAVRVAESTPEELVVTIPPLLPDSAELDEDALASTAAGSTPVCIAVPLVAAAGLVIHGLSGSASTGIDPKVQIRR